MKSLNGRVAELARIAAKPCEITYADTGFIAPNRWISREIILEFESQGLIERKGKRAVITSKGIAKLEGVSGGANGKVNNRPKEKTDANEFSRF